MTLYWLRCLGSSFSLLLFSWLEQNRRMTLKFLRCFSKAWEFASFWPVWECPCDDQWFWLVKGAEWWGNDEDCLRNPWIRWSVSLSNLFIFDSFRFWFRSFANLMLAQLPRFWDTLDTEKKWTFGQLESSPMSCALSFSFPIPKTKQKY